MALGTGTLYLGPGGVSSNTIRYEILGGYGAYDLSDAITASAKGYNSMLDFRGYSHGGPPSQPTKCATTQQSFLGMRCNWFDTSDNETGFKIQWSVNGGGYGEEQTVGAGTTQVYRNCSQGSSYRGRVKAYNASGDSSWCTSGSAPVGDLDCFI